MKVDKEVLLERLLTADDYISFEELSETFGCTRRTLYRYINEINSLYKERHMYVETKYGKGIKLSGNTYAVPFDTVYSDKVRFIGFSPEQRQLAEIIYYSVRDEEIKTSALASLLNVSHSTVDSDITAVEQTVLQNKAFKGVRFFTTHHGRGMLASLWDRRMIAVFAASRLYSVQDNGRALLDKQENASIKQLKALLSLSVKHQLLIDAVYAAERSMQCTFSLSDFMLLYYYLTLVVSNPYSLLCKESEVLVRLKNDAGFVPVLEPVVPDRIAGHLLRMFDIDNVLERYLLRVVLSSLESVRFTEKVFLDTCIPEYIHAAEIRLFEHYQLTAPLQKELKLYLAVQLNSIIYKTVYSIPKNTENYTGYVPEYDMDSLKVVSVPLLDAINPLLQKRCGIRLTLQDIAPACIAISTEHKQQHESLVGLRVLVICYEGVCLSRIIASILRMYFPEHEIINMTGIESLTETYLEKNAIDVLVTTVLPTIPSGTPVPCYRIENPADRVSVVDGFRQFLEENALLFKKKEAARSVISADNATTAAIHTVFKHFTISELDKPLRKGRITAKLASIVVEDAEKRKQLQRAFDLREKKGHVYLQVENIQLFHCRCDCVQSARAGLVRCQKDDSVILYLIAPQQASKDELMALSLISSALIEADEFAQALHIKDAAEIESILQHLIV
ncbi:MAG: HTH domain-containing protein [Treponema sp.]|nr:HTH domain-containing protein [Treponema sp.]